MANICINMNEKDLDDLRKMAEEQRVPYTILARMLIIQGMKAPSQVQEFNKSH